MMVEWWEHDGPPVAVSVAGYLGLLKPRTKVKKIVDEATGKVTTVKETGDLNELLKMAGPGGMLN